MSVNRDRGKSLERSVAKALNGKRVGTMGGEDVQAGLFSVECKSRVKFIGKSFMAQAIRNCPEGRLPCVVVHIQGARHADDLVMLRMSDFRDLYGELEGRWAA